MVSGRSSSLLSLGAGLTGFGLSTGLLGISAGLLAGTGSGTVFVPLLAAGGAGAGAGAVADPAEGAIVLMPSGLSSSLSDMVLCLGPSSRSDQVTLKSESPAENKLSPTARHGTLGQLARKALSIAESADETERDSDFRQRAL